MYRKDESTTTNKQPPTRLSKLYFQRKSQSSSSEAQVKPKKNAITTTLKPDTTTAENVVIVTPVSYHQYRDDGVISLVDTDDDDDDSAANDDAALLSTDDNRLDHWQNELIAASAGAGQEPLPTPQKDDSKKTLSDQVAEGKYGLIQTELFSKPPKRPGIISYLSNPEVPSDTADNLGGLDEEDIWLAEDHLLVLRGGHLNHESKDEPWKPIDNYEAPRRPVLLPDNPKVPPPFLVQLEDNAPVQFIGNNQFPLINPFTNESLLLFPPSSGFPKADTFGSDQANIFTRRGSPNRTATASQPENNGGGGYQYPSPNPSWPSPVHNNQTIQNPFLSGQLTPPIRMPFPNFPPPQGSLDNSNFTDYFDEDDPSLYYPPPYSFTFHSNYTNPVPAGPLVPGIILPPPPNFFRRENMATTTAATVTPSPLPPRQKQYKQIVRPSTATRTTSSTIKTTPTTSRTTSTTKPTSTTTYRPYTIKLRPTSVTEKSAEYRVIPAVTSPSTTKTTRPIITTLRKVVTTPEPSHLPAQQKDPISQLNHQMDLNPKTAPVYYEYFDATRQQKPATTIIKETSPEPPTIVAVAKSPTTTKLLKQSKQRPYNAYLPIKPFDYDKYVYITPKPEIIPNGISSNHITTAPAAIDLITIDDQKLLQPARQPRPIQQFNEEVDAIRQTLQYYNHRSPAQSAQKEYNQQPPVQPKRISKAKAVYEYSYEAATTASPAEQTKFSHPDFDTTPFKPMVQYSEPMNDGDGFKAMTEPRLPPTTTEAPATVDSFYSTIRTSNLYPVPANRANSARNYIPRKPPSAPAPQVYYDGGGGGGGAADNSQPYYFGTSVKQQQPQPHYDVFNNNNNNYYSNKELSARNPPQSEEPWISIEKQVFRHVVPHQPKEINVQIQSDEGVNGGYPLKYDRYSGNNYYYTKPTQSPEYFPMIKKQVPSHNPAYMKQIEQIRQHISRYPPLQQQQQQSITLINDTSINYNNHQLPPINPDSEFIEPYISTQQQQPQQQHRWQYPQQQQHQYQQQRYPMPPPQRQPLPNSNRFYPPNGHQQQPYTLAKDTLVNFKYPLPLKNGDSEYLPEDRYNGRRYNADGGGGSGGVVQYKLPGDRQAGVYFFTPQYQNDK